MRNRSDERRSSEPVNKKNESWLRRLRKIAKELSRRLRRRVLYSRTITSLHRVERHLMLVITTARL